LFPHGVLFRREEAALREKLVKSDLLECVLGLGPGLFYNSPMEAVVVTLRSRKPEKHQGKVLFINAVNDYVREQAQSFLHESHQQKILAAYEAFADIDGFAAVATLGQIGEKDYSLAMPLYVGGSSTDTPEDTVDVEAAVTQWRTASSASDAALDDVIAILRQEAAR
jgi:type I restriction enzyme M protein